MEEGNGNGSCHFRPSSLRSLSGNRTPVRSSWDRVGDSSDLPAYDLYASSRGPRCYPVFTRPSNDTVCLFPNNDFTGSYPCCNGPVGLTSVDFFTGAWFTFDHFSASNPNPGSITNHFGDGYCFYVYSKQNTQLDWVLPHQRMAFFHLYGYIRLVSSDANCTHHPSPPS